MWSVRRDEFGKMVHKAKAKATGGGEGGSRNGVNRLVSDSGSEAGAAGEGGVKRTFSMLILIPQCDIRRIFRGDRRVSCSCVLVGGEWGKMWLGREARGISGQSSFRVRERLAAMRLVLCSTGSRLFQSSLAGARGGQVVAVLVLCPKPQPLLVLLLWFFRSVLSRATWE